MASFKLDDLPPDMRAQALAQVAKQPVVPKPIIPKLQFGLVGVGPKLTSYFFTVQGEPMGKPRMTRSDKWKKRDCVVRYRAWADEIRAACTADLKGAIEVKVEAYFSLPKCSQRKQEAMKGVPKRTRPDADNILKAVCDALFQEDGAIASMSCKKFWDDGAGARVEIMVFL